MSGYLISLTCLLLVLENVKISSAFWPFRTYRGCELDVDSGLSQQDPPVLLRRGAHGYELATPDDVITVRRLFGDRRRAAVLRLPYEEELYAACPGNGNYLYGLREVVQFATFKCMHSNNVLGMDRQRFRSERVRCAEPASTVIRATGRRCGHGAAREYDLGYSIAPESNPSAHKPETYGLFCWLKNPSRSSAAFQEGESGFYPVFSTCYDPTTVCSVYSTNVLQGDKIAGAAARVESPVYIAGQASLYPPGFDISKAYSYQKEALTKAIGPKTSTALLNNTLLTQGRLASELDFPMASWRASSFAYVNLVPRWLSVDQGNWRKLEDKIRKLAEISQSTLIITTGTHGTLQLPDEQNNTQQLFLDHDRKLLPVPEILWKVVYSAKNSSCIAFVVSNNPWDNSPTPPCNDICTEHGWEENSWAIPWEGRLVCCDVEALRNIVPYVPRYRCANVLGNE